MWITEARRENDAPIAPEFVSSAPLRASSPVTINEVNLLIDPAYHIGVVRGIVGAVMAGEQLEKKRTKAEQRQLEKKKAAGFDSIIWALKHQRDVCERKLFQKP